MKSRSLFFGNLETTNISSEELLRTIHEHLETHSKCWIAYGEISGVLIASHNANYREALHHFDIVFPAGRGIYIASKILGYLMPHTYQGTDALPNIFTFDFTRTIKVFLIGSGLNTLDLIKKKIETSPYFEVAGRADGYADAEDTESVLEKIDRAKPDLLLVGMGVPKQEQWVARHSGMLTVPVIVCVGNLFEFLAGTIPRAPLWMRKIGLEWFHRLILEPRRLFKRYVFGIPHFCWIILRQKFATL